MSCAGMAQGVWGWGYHRSVHLEGSVQRGSLSAHFPRYKGKACHHRFRSKAFSKCMFLNDLCELRSHSLNFLNFLCWCWISNLNHETTLCWNLWHLGEKVEDPSLPISLTFGFCLPFHVGRIRNCWTARSCACIWSRNLSANCLLVVKHFSAFLISEASSKRMETSNLLSFWWVMMNPSSEYYICIWAQATHCQNISSFRVSSLTTLICQHVMMHRLMFSSITIPRDLDKFYSLMPPSSFNPAGTWSSLWSESMLHW